MSKPVRRAWIVAYDIADPRRLARTHRFLKGTAIPLQYSVFVSAPASGALGRIVTGIRQHIHPREDDVRIYPVTSPCEIVLVGGDWPVRTVTLADARLGPFLRHQFPRAAGRDCTVAGDISHDHS